MTPDDALAAIFGRHRLGDVHHISTPMRGSINTVRFVAGHERHYVVRFDLLESAMPHTRFTGEALLLERLRREKFPVPDVIACDTSRADVPYPYLILSRLPGQSLSEGWHALDANAQHRIAQQAGELLVRLHSITHSHFGQPDGLYEAPFARWCDFVQHRTDFFMQRARELHRLSETMIARIAAWHQHIHPLLEHVQQPRLAHRDFQFNNVLHVSDHITGVIDFEWSVWGDAAWDFANRYQWEAQCPGIAAPMLSAYGTPDAEFTARADFYRLLHVLDDVSWMWEDGNHDESVAAAVTLQLLVERYEHRL